MVRSRARAVKAALFVHTSTRPKREPKCFGTGQLARDVSGSRHWLVDGRSACPCTKSMSKAWWELAPGPERDAAKKKQEPKSQPIFHGPVRHVHDVAARTWHGWHSMTYVQRGDASELWAHAATLQPFDPIMAQCTPTIHLDSLWVEFRGTRFYVGSSVSDVRRLLRELHNREEKQ